MSSSLSLRQPTRDKTTWVSYFQATCFGWFVYGFGATLPFLRDDLGITSTVASFHSLAMATGSVSAGFATRALMGKLGRGRLLRTSSLFAMVGLTMYGLGPALPFTLLGIAMTAFFGSLIIQATGAYLSHHQGAAAPASISELHAMAAGIGLLSPVLVGLGVTIGIGWRPAILMPVLGLAVIELWRGKNIFQYGPPSSHDVTSSHHDAPGKLPRNFWFAFIIIICTASTEFSMLLWASEVLRNAGMANGASAAALGTVVGGMFVGRFAGSRLTTRVDSEKLYRASLALALVGFLGFWLSSDSVIMMVMLAITGLGISVHFPLGIDRAMRASEGRADHAAGRVSIGAGLASGIAPFALGAMADHIGVHYAYTFVPVSLVIALILATVKPVPSIKH